MSLLLLLLLRGSGYPLFSLVRHTHTPSHTHSLARARAHTHHTYKAILTNTKLITLDSDVSTELAGRTDVLEALHEKSSARKNENPLFDEDDAAAAATQKEADEAVGTQAAATTTSVS